ncbi:MAG: M23 family metallopeptidase [Cyanobacteria bacterium]|nr:M23 family metallopeptidase [Cyanobacteriota bacterium]
MSPRSWLASLALLVGSVGFEPYWGQDVLLLPEAPRQVPTQVIVPDVLPQETWVVSRVLAPAAAASSAIPQLGYPLAQAAESMDPWGWRFSKLRSAWRMHTGVDLAAPQGTSVLAAQAGRVALVETVSGYGNTVLLKHGGGWQTLYAHLHATTVVSGQLLDQGESLGSVGMTGSASGPHLHFELRRQGSELLALDPTPHLPPLLPPPPLPPLVATIEP